MIIVILFLDSNLSVLYDDTLNETYFEQCFENIKKLGEGSFGEVYKVRYKEDGLLYAVKKTRRVQLFIYVNFNKQIFLLSTH